MAPNTSSQRQSILQFLVVFLVLYFLSQALLGVFFPQRPENGKGTEPILLQVSGTGVSEGTLPTVTAQNQTASGITIASRCPRPPLDVFRVSQQNGTEIITPLAGTGTAIPCSALPLINPEGRITIDLSPWKYSIFGELGTYELRLPGAKALPAGTGAVLAQAPDRVRFSIHEPGSFTKLFRAILSRPFLNVLIFVGSLTPGHSLALGIIILTLLVKILLFFPTQKSLEGQKKMQLLQPKLDELKKRYPEDAKKQQEETMRLWKEHGINPFSSCLPLLIQFPVLLGLYYVIRDGSRLELSRHLIYPFYQHLSWTFGTQFLWMDLLKPDHFVMPLLLVVLQYLQMKLTFAIQKRKKGDQAPTSSAMGTQQQVMLYALPIMIGFFAFQFPAAVALYWGVSTLFGIGQQLIVNREHLKV